MKNKIVIVTGGSGLIGKAILNDLKSKGAIPINFDISSITSEIEFLKCDITDDNSIKNTVSMVITKYGRIDGLVNSAYPRTKDWGEHYFDEIPFESWRKNIDYQLNSYAFFCQEVLKIMSMQGAGSIVNIASIYGSLGNDFTIYENTNIKPPPAYSAIKGGIINLTRYLASYYGKYGVTINCVSPGGIFDNQAKEFVEAYEKKVPLKRMGRPIDIAPTVSFLISEEAKYITGQNIVVDGGWSAI